MKMTNSPEKTEITTSAGMIKAAGSRCNFFALAFSGGFFSLQHEDSVVGHSLPETEAKYSCQAGLAGSSRETLFSRHRRASGIPMA